MADVNVKTVSLELKTCKLTKAILKQIPMISYSQYANVRSVFTEEGHEVAECVIGWVHGSVLGADHDHWLIVKTPDGYGRLNIGLGGNDLRKKYPQIYIV
jgi:hypothetical protein